MKLLIVLALAVAVSAANLDSVAHPGFPEGRIINGQAAEKGEAPFIVSLERNGAHFCGGSIIDEHHVLTAAHCLIYANEQVQVVAGLHSRNLQSDVQKRQATKQIKHADYGGGVGPNDIGLIYVAEAFNLNTVARDGSAAVAKINAGSNKYEQAGNGVLYGWGRDNSGALPIDLQKLNADIIGYEACKKATNNTPSLAPTNICTFTPDKADGACNGDSGGPLIEKTSKGANLVGIVSWGWVPCASVKLPSVYTSVAAHLDWIEQNKVNSFIVEELL